jgi:hypothetical protein
LEIEKGFGQKNQSRVSRLRSTGRMVRAGLPEKMILKRGGDVAVQEE